MARPFSTVTKEIVLACLAADPLAAVAQLWAWQEEIEKSDRDSLFDNERGFSKRYVHRGSILGMKIASGVPLTLAEIHECGTIAAYHYKQFLAIAREHERAINKALKTEKSREVTPAKIAFAASTFDALTAFEAFTASLVPVPRPDWWYMADEASETTDAIDAAW